MEKNYFEVSLENKNLDISSLFEKDLIKIKKVYLMIPEYPEFISLEDLFHKASEENPNLKYEEIIRSTTSLLSGKYINVYSLEGNDIPFYQRVREK